MKRIWGVVLGVAVGATAALWLADTAAAQDKQVVIGGMCDRTGPTQVNDSLIPEPPSVSAQFTVTP